MASPGTEHEAESASSATNASSGDEREGAKPFELKPKTKAEVPSAAETKTGAEGESEREASPIETTAPPVPVDAPVLTAPLQTAAAEMAPASEPAGAVPSDATSVGAPAERTAPLAAPADTPAASSSPSIEPSTAPSPLLARLGPRPSSAWLAVGGAAAVLTFVAGVFTGRGLRDPERRTATATVPPKAAPAASATAAPVVAPSGESASATLARPRMVGTATKPSSAGFNAQAAKLAIDRVVPRLKACKQAGEPPGSATVTVTFAPTGRVSSAQVTNTRYAGTRTGNCIAQRLREARVPEFSGAPVTVKRSVAVR